MIRRPPRSTLFPLHDALPISPVGNGIGLIHPSMWRNCLENGWRGLDRVFSVAQRAAIGALLAPLCRLVGPQRSEEPTSELQSRQYLVCRLLLEKTRDTLQE